MAQTLDDVAIPQVARKPRAASARPKSRAFPRLRAYAPIAFAYLAALGDIASIFAAAFAASVIYQLAPFSYQAHIASAAPVVALIVVWSSLQRGEYKLETYLRKNGQTSRAFGAWNLAFMAVLTLAFAAKQSQDVSRLAMVLFYALGYPTLVVTRRAFVDLAQGLLAYRVIEPRRVVIIGFEDRLTAIQEAGLDFGPGFDLVSLMELRDHQAYLADDLALAAAAVRMYRADDVCLAVPWSRQDVIEPATTALLRTPAEVHLDADRLLEQFSHARFSRLGAMTGLRITRPKLTLIQRLQKRVFDLVAASVGLVLLAPLLGLIALLVRLESAGPALFRQTRYGFNQEPFQVFKFRSMRTMENGAQVVAARRNDPRVTRLGAYLRRFSLDELPQLLNVLRGEMSIVGPRPHAMAHDQRYFDRLSRYARRHNMKPGITGWAQVHGHRGEIANDHEMLARLEHDLYYVDNWSLWLDVKIVLMTVFSPKAHRNAF